MNKIGKVGTAAAAGALALALGAGAPFAAFGSGSGHAKPAAKPKPIPPIGSGAQLKFDEFGNPRGVELNDPTNPGDTDESLNPIAIVSTGKLPAGRYEVTGTAAIEEEGVCWLDTREVDYSAGDVEQLAVSIEGVSATLTAPFKVSDGTRVSVWCASFGGDDEAVADAMVLGLHVPAVKSDITDEQFVISAGITAVNVRHNIAGSHAETDPLPSEAP